MNLLNLVNVYVQTGKLSKSLEINLYEGLWIIVLNLFGAVVKRTAASS